MVNLTHSRCASVVALNAAADDDVRTALVVAAMVEVAAADGQSEMTEVREEEEEE
jgi:uncharacterized membrane protein YebE (DUF533 family)